MYLPKGKGVAGVVFPKVYGVVDYYYIIVFSFLTWQDSPIPFVLPAQILDLAERMFWRGRLPYRPRIV